MTMIYKILTIIFCLFPAFCEIEAKTPEVQMLEAELRCGLTLPIGSYHNGSAQVSGDLGIEGRFNLKNTPWDCGIMLELSTARRGFNHMFDDNLDRWQNNRTLGLAILGDYNFCQGKKINPFVGIALGAAFNDVVGDKYYPSKGVSMLLSPRIGVEFLHHIRLMVQINVCRKGYSNVGLTLGFVLGGKPRN